MGEIDTKPIESVQTAITFLGEENDKEMDMERELANVRVQLEAKDAVDKQALVKKNFYINQSHGVESALAHKSANIDSLQLGMEQAKELLIMSEMLAASEVDMMKEEMEAEMEMIQSEVERVKRSREADNEAQVEIALLKFQLHKGRSRLAAAEAAEARAQSEKTALYKALQQMGLEAEETKKENRMLQEAAKLADDPKQEELMITSNTELEDVKRELEVAVSKIGELRTRVEQATSRAEAAEKQNRRRRDHKERRKAALAALRLESVSRELERKSVVKDDDDDYEQKICQPLGKVLNMKF